MNYKLKTALIASFVVGLGAWFAFVSLASATATGSPDAVLPFNPATLYVRETLPVPYANELDLAADKNLLYVTQWNANGSITGLTAINTINYIATSIPLGSGFPMDVRILPDDTRAYVGISKRNGYISTSGNNRVIVISTATNSVVGSILTGDSNPYGPTRMDISANGSRLYVTERGLSQLDVINTATNTIINTIPVGLGGFSPAVMPNGNRVYTANREANSVSAIDAISNVVIATIPLSITQSDALMSLEISSDEHHAYVVGTSSGEIAVLDLNPNSPTYHQQIDSLPTSGNSLGKIALTSDDHYAFVTSRTTDELLVIDIEPTSPTFGTQVGQVTVGDAPFSVVLQENIPGVIAYVSNYDDGTISVIGYQDAIAGLAAANDGPTVIGNSTHLTATITAGTDVTYTWAFGDGSYGSGITSTHVYPALGSYAAIVTATNQVSQMVANTTVEVVDVPVSGLTASNSSPTIIGNQTFLAAATTSGSNIQYTWAFGDGTYGNGANPTHTYPAVGNYTAIVTATNTNNSLSTTTPVTVIDVAISGLAAANDSPTILSNPTHLSATVSGGTNIQYSWAFGDGTYGNGANPAHTYPAVGNYTAVVTATNSNNSQSADTLVTIEAGITHTFLPLLTYCDATPIWADIALVIDTSGSMADPTEPGGVTKLVAAQNAAATFLSFLDFASQHDQATLVSFDDTATLEHPLSRNETTLLAAINGLQLGSLTRMDLGLQTARLELTGIRHDPDNQTVMIFLTDGHPNGTTESQVLAQATLAKDAGITIYTIGLGSDINASLLQNIASNPAYYYPSPSTGDLNAIYQQIASSFACR